MQKVYQGQGTNQHSSQDPILSLLAAPDQRRGYLEI